jgi:hypothetical protein
MLAVGRQAGARGSENSEEAMGERTRELLRRFLSLRIVVPVLIVVGAFVGTFVPKPFGLERDQLLLALLAFLAMDALIERLELLTNIEKDVGAIKQKDI